MIHYSIFYRTAFVGLLRQYKHTNSEPEDWCSTSSRNAMPRDRMTLSLSVCLSRYVSGRKSPQSVPATSDGGRVQMARRARKHEVE